MFRGPSTIGLHATADADPSISVVAGGGYAESKAGPARARADRKKTRQTLLSVSEEGHSWDAPILDLRPWRAEGEGSGPGRLEHCP